MISFNHGVSAKIQTQYHCSSSSDGRCRHAGFKRRIHPGWIAVNFSTMLPVVQLFRLIDACNIGLLSCCVFLSRIYNIIVVFFPIFFHVPSAWDDCPIGFFQSGGRLIPQHPRVGTVQFKVERAGVPLVPGRACGQQLCVVTRCMALMAWEKLHTTTQTHTHTHAKKWLMIIVG